MIEIDWTLINTTNESIQYINNTLMQIQGAYQSEHTMKWFFIITTIIAISSFFLLRKQFKANKDNVKRTEMLSDKILEEFKKLEKGEKVEEIDIRDLPKPVQTDILESPSIISRMFFKSDKDGYKPPFLLLIRSDMTAEIMHNAKEGILKLRKKDKDKTDVMIHLSAQKLLDLKIAGKRRRFWIHFEDEAESYPTFPKHHSMILYQIVHKLQMTKGLIGEKKGKFPKILLIIGAVAIIGGIAAYYYFGKKTPTADEVQATTTIVNETIRNFTNNVTLQVKM